MSYDIYGNDLARGHCEVHPHVRQEYPCFVCLSESARKKREQDEQRRHHKEMEAAYYAQIAGDIEYESWSASI